MHMRTFGITEEIGYKEVNFSDGIINKIYEIDNSSKQKIVTIPDGCIDIEITVKDNKATYLLCGSRREGMFSEVGDYDYCFGIKFDPGCLPDEINANIGDMINARIDLSKLTEIKESDMIRFEKSSFEDKVAYFTQMYNEKQKNKEEIDVTEYVLNKIASKHGAVNIAKMVEEIGYSQCYINRIFKKSMGFSIKKYAEIIRIQQSIHMLNQNKEEEVYDKLGFYDQSHFIKEFKKFTTFTPQKYMENTSQIRFM